MGGGKKSSSSAPAPVPQPTVDTADEKAKQMAEVALRRRGRQANILTGKLGANTTEGVAQKQLLGGPK